jgi:hypothetical protein
MLGAILGCCGGSLGQHFEILGVHEYQSKGLLGQMRCRVLGALDRSVGFNHSSESQEGWIESTHASPML